MKFTSTLVVALLVATSTAVRLEKKDDNGTGLSYDLDVPALRKAEADNAAKTQAFNGATAAHSTATNNMNVAKTNLDSATSANTAALKERTEADDEFKLGNYKKAAFPGQEDRRTTAVGAQDAALNSKLQAFDDHVEKTHIFNRKTRDLNAATAAKDASDANLEANQNRVANEKDQLMRGENQDRLKFVNQDSKAKVSEIQAKHDERERANARLFKALASF